MVTDTPQRQPTLDEVAKRADISRTAASRVITSPHVGQAKRDIVKRAILDLRYTRPGMPVMMPARRPDDRSWRRHAGRP